MFAETQRAGVISALCAVLIAGLGTVGTGASASEAPAPSFGTSGIISPGNQTYTIDATWNNDTRTLTGTESISFTNLRAPQLGTVYVRTWPNGQRTGPRPCSAPYVVLTSVSGGSFGTLPHGMDPGDCTARAIDLNAPLNTGQSGEVTLGFTDTVHGNDWDFRYGISGSGTMMANAFPILAVTDDRGVHLEPYNIKGESMYSIAAAWHVTLTLDADLQVPSSGNVTSTTLLPGGMQRLVLDAPDVRDFALAIGHFDMQTATDGGLTIRYFSQPGTKVPPADVLQWAKDAVDAYRVWYGPYNATQLDMVEGTWSQNGFENPNFIMIAPSQTIVYHEVAHMWWYSMVGDNQYSSPWVDEAFATFSAHRLNGTNVTWNVRRPFKWAFDNTPLDATMRSFPHGSSWNYWAVVYYGGSHVLEYLRRAFGDTQFDQFMQYLQASYHDGIETTCDVQHAVETFAPAGFDSASFSTWARIRPGVGTAC